MTNIRDARPEDVDSIIRLAEALAAHEETSLSKANHSERLRTHLFCDSPKVYCLVAEAGNKITGFACYSVEYSLFNTDDYLRLNAMYVEPGGRRNGVGKMLIKTLKKKAVQFNCGHIRLLTPQSNTIGINFYQSIGATGKKSIRFYIDADE